MGTRLHPLTLTRPKPLLPIGNLPIIARIILALRRQNIREFLLLLHYRPEAFLAQLGNGEAFDAAFEYCILEKDLSTAGSVRFIREQIHETCLIHAADILTEAPVAAMLEFHRSKRSLATIALCPQPAPLSFGIVRRQPDGRILQFLEKPTWPEVFSDWVNAGVYIVEPELLDHIPESREQVYFEKHVFPQLAAKAAPLYGFPIQGYWRDVGTPEDLRVANLEFLDGKLPTAFLTREEAARHRQERSYLAYGEGNRIASTALLSESVIRSGCQIAPHTRITRSVLLDEVSVLEGATIDSAIVMDRVQIGPAARLLPNSLVGEGAQIEAGAVIQANGIVRPLQRVASGQIVATQRALPVGYLRRLVDCGELVAEDFSADFLHWLGRAFGVHQTAQRPALLESGVAPTGGEAASILLAAAHPAGSSEESAPLLAGLLAAGCEVALLQPASVPLARQALLSRRYAGGIYWGNAGDANLLRLILLDHHGHNFSTAATCALEFEELSHHRGRGRFENLDAERVRREYVSALTNAFAPPAAGIPACHVHVSEAGLEQLVAHFAEAFSMPLAVVVDESAARSHTICGRRESWCFSLESNGERLRLHHADTGRAVSDLLFSHLFRQAESTTQIFNWLMDALAGTGARTGRRVLSLAGVRPRFAEFGRTAGLESWVGFDGRGGIIQSAWQAHPDALAALACVLPRLASAPASEWQVDPLGHQFFSCPAELKAQWMRRLLERFAAEVTGISDGVRFGGEWDWVIVRPCASAAALELFYWENASRSADSFIARVLHSLQEWKQEAEDRTPIGRWE